MEKTEIDSKTFDRRNFYNDDDSGKIYLFALILPIVIAILFTLIANIIVGASGQESEAVTGNIWYSTALQIVSACASVVLFIVYNKTNKISFSAVKLEFKMSYKNYLIVILVGIVALFGIQYFIGAVDDLLGLIGYPLEVSSPDMAESLTNPKSFGVFILSVFVTCILPSITEELLFRGVILQGLRRRFGDISAIFLSAIMFALMHQNLQQLVYPFLLGSVMAWVVVRTGSLVSSMIVHFINNFLVILFTYLQNVTSFSLDLGSQWWFYLLAVALLAVTAGIFFLIDRFFFKHKSKEEIQEKSQKTSKFIYISLAVSGVLFLVITIFNFAL